MQLRVWRETHGLTLRQVALLIGLSRDQVKVVQRYETGERTPSLELINKFHDITDGQVTMDDFLVLERCRRSRWRRAA